MNKINTLWRAAIIASMCWIVVMYINATEVESYHYFHVGGLQISRAGEFVLTGLLPVIASCGALWILDSVNKQKIYDFVLKIRLAVIDNEARIKRDLILAVALTLFLAGGFFIFERMDEPRYVLNTPSARVSATAPIKIRYHQLKKMGYTDYDIQQAVMSGELIFDDGKDVFDRLRDERRGR